MSAERFLRITELRAWQSDALAAWRAADRKGIIEAVTGAGKSHLGYVAMAEAMQSGGRTLVLVPSAELLRQWTRALKERFPHAKIGAFGAGKVARGDEDVIVSIVNTASNRARERWFVDWIGDEPGLLVGDECHRYAASSFSAALDPAFGQRLGLTATLARPDGGDEEYLLPYFESRVFSLEYDRALADDVVAPWSITRVGVSLSGPEGAQYRRFGQERDAATRRLENLWDMHRSDPGFFDRVARAASAKTRSTPQRLASQYMTAFSKQREVTSKSGAKLVAFSKALGLLEAGEPALVFTATKDAAEAAARVAVAAQLSSRVVHSDVSQRERANALEDFEEGEVQTLLAPRVLDEGVDVPDCGVAYILGMTASPRQLKQRLGRIIRKSPTKQVARLFYLYAIDTHEDPQGSFGSAQWGSVTQHAVEVRDLTTEDFVRG